VFADPPRPAAGPLAGPTCKATGVVLERREWSEASQILTLYTAEYGRLKALAKGARRPKSRHGGGCDLLDQVAVVLYPRERGLHLVAETALLPVQPARRLRRRLAALLGAIAMAETVRDGTPEHEPAPALHDDLVATLRALGDAPQAGPVVAAFEWRFLAATGDAPRLDDCAACGMPLPPGAVAFAVAAGGAVCPECRPEAPGPVRTVTAAGRDALRRLADAPAALPPRPLREARATLAAMFRASHGRPRRADRFAAMIEVAGASPAGAPPPAGRSEVA
jgi:DNA repair protein RecO (recombination protein O)